MSYAALQSKSESSPTGLRVGPANDSFEHEADRVGETVGSGGSVTGLTLSRMSMGQLQRQVMPAPSAEPINRRGTGAAIEEAFEESKLGKQLRRRLSGGPHSEKGEAHAAEIQGEIVSGGLALELINQLVEARGVLPARLPEISLDRIFTGLKATVHYEGPSHRPKHAYVILHLAPPGAEKHEKAAVPAGDRHEKPAPPAAAPSAPRHGDTPGAAPKAEPKVVRPTVHSNSAGAIAKHEPLHGNVRPGPAQDSSSKHEPLSVQRKADPSSPLMADRSIVDPVLRSSGRPLDTDTRAYMESRIGYDFGSVRIHTDAAAGDSARAMGAQAYTAGNDVVFAPGKYSPGTPQGRTLLAHELTHVVQQDHAPGRAHPVIRRAPVQIRRAPEEESGSADTGSGSWFTSPKEKLKAVVRRIPGFKLFTVIIGWDPVSDVKVERSASNVVHGVLDLVPGGEEAYQHLTESGALEKGYQWVTQKIDEMGLTLGYFKDLVNQALGSVKWGDITDPMGALSRIAGFFSPAYEKLKKFALEALDKLLEVIVEGVLSALGGLGVLDVLRKAGAAFKLIVKDPVGFLGNLLKAIGQGVTQFKDNILEHLKNGLVEWLFGAVAATGIVLPKKFDLGGILNLVLQVLGLTYSKLRGRLVDVVGEAPVAFLEGAFDVVVAMKNQGLAGAWKLILEKASGLIDTIMEGIRNWVITKIITAAIVRLIGLFNPIGAVIQAIQMIYKTVMFFIEKIKQIAALCNAVLDSVTEIANGNIMRAANFVEQSMARTVPLIIGFLADLIGLGGIAEEIKKIIHKVQETVWNAIKKVLDFLIGKAKELYGKGKDAVSQAVGWWKDRKSLDVDGESHTVFMDGTEEAPQVMIASDAKPWSEYFKAEDKPSDPKKAKLWDALVADAAALNKPIKPAAGATDLDKDKSRQNNIDERRKQFNDIADKIQLLGLHRDPKTPASVITYAPPLKNGGGVKATASILSSKHPPGTEPSDDAPIWENLGPIRGEKNYVQGHLLNHNLGGEGRRFNLTPINKQANSHHLHQMEKYVKKWVANDHVVSYEVRAVYVPNGQPKPKEYLKLLEKAKTSRGLTKTEANRLDGFRAEQQLPVSFECVAQGLAFDASAKKWTPDADKFNKNLKSGEERMPAGGKRESIDTRIAT